MGEMLSVFFILCFFCPVRGFLSFFCRSSFLRVVFWKNFRERTFVFGWLCWSWVFLGFLLLLLLHIWRFAPETVRKKFSCCQVWCFFGVVLFFFGFFADVVFRGFFFLRQRSGSHRTPLHTHLFCCSLFLFCVPPLFSVPPVLAVRPASWRFFRGAILGPGRFWDSP